MTIPSEEKVAVSGPRPHQGSNPKIGELQIERYRTCANERCRKGPNGTRGEVKSRRAQYCCAYCRVDACRRNRPNYEQVEKPARKRRKDAKYGSHAEREKAYYDRHRPYQLPQQIKDLIADKKATTVSKPARTMSKDSIYPDQ